jgi:hypothetical protein
MNQPIDAEEFAKFAATKSESSPTRATRRGYDEPDVMEVRRSENDSIVADRINQQLNKKKVDRRLHEQVRSGQQTSKRTFGAQDENR